MKDLHKPVVDGVVVTFNRKELLEACLESLLGQTLPLRRIILVDNASTDGTREMLENKGHLTDTRLKYIPLSENIGGAGGFAIGIEEGIRGGADWLWIMDDDSIPKTDALAHLIHSDLIAREGTIALCSKVTARDGSINMGTRRTMDSYFREHVSTEKDYENNFFEINLFSFVGVLLRVEALRQTGLPLKDYFIFFDDTEYSLRLSRYGKIYVISESVVFHELPKKAKDEWKVTWRLFFLIRNPIHMYKRLILDSQMNLILKALLFFRVVVLGSVIKPLMRPFLVSTYRGQRIAYFWVALHAVWEGITGRFRNDLDRIKLMCGS